MALTVPTDAYATVADVQARTLQTFTDDTNPSTGEVEQFLRSGKERIDAALRTLGAPFGSDKTTALSILKPINADYAAARVLAPQRERYDADLVSKRWRTELRAIRQGDLDLDLEDKDTLLAFIDGQYFRG